MLSILEELFLVNGGDKTWLIVGLKVVPEKLMKLAKFNNIMAHQPWKIKTSDIYEIYKGSSASSNWNFNEFVHASLILFHFHKMASFIESLDLSVKHKFSFSKGYEMISQISKLYIFTSYF